MFTVRSFRTAAVALAAIFLAAPSAGAQELRSGDRIRVNMHSGDIGELIGVYHASEPENLVVYTGESARAKIPWDDISRLQLSHGEQSNAGKGALIGLAIGGGLGLVAVIATAADPCEGFCPGDPGTAGVVALGAVLAGAGAGVGALIGAATKSERWQTIPRQQWQIQVAPDLKGGVAIGISLRL